MWTGHPSCPIETLPLEYSGNNPGRPSGKEWDFQLGIRTLFISDNGKKLWEWYENARNLLEILTKYANEVYWDKMSDQTLGILPSINTGIMLCKIPTWFSQCLIRQWEWCETAGNSLGNSLNYANEVFWYKVSDQTPGISPKLSKYKYWECYAGFLPCLSISQCIW